MRPNEDEADDEGGSGGQPESLTVASDRDKKDEGETGVRVNLTGVEPIEGHGDIAF